MQQYIVRQPLQAIRQEVSTAMATGMITAESYQHSEKTILYVTSSGK